MATACISFVAPLAAEHVSPPQEQLLVLHAVWLLTSSPWIPHTLQHDIEEYTGRLKSMSCVHPQSLKDFLKAPDVLSMDTIFRTNKNERQVLKVVSDSPN
ncbi:hypothetical protein E4U22_005686 [Claviceps purpurea]|nr:hypothetical protein E4U22_005686 [Claviceps purpurea]